MAHEDAAGIDTTVIQAKVLTVSDGVIAGTREDRSGVALDERLRGAGFDVVDRRVVADGTESVAGALREMAGGFVGVVVSTGGTGFGPRDLTPEGTRAVIDREAPGLAEAMRLVNPLGRLSRGVAGTRGRTLILNTPGSPKGAVECLDAVIDIVPHAVRLMSDAPTSHQGAMTAADDERYLRLAIANAQTVRLLTPPNPWVGAVVVATDGAVHQGATSEPGGAHAEVLALQRAGATAEGATLYTTLEPCSHDGRTPPCADAIVAAGVARVVIGVEDPDPHVAGRGIAILRAAGIEVTVGVAHDAVVAQLQPYLHHRRTGRPWVVCKLAATLDGRIAAPDGSSQWITGAIARSDAHRVRAESGAIVVGAGTVRADDPSLTVRDFIAPGDVPERGLDPVRVVLGAAPADARVQPARSFRGDPAVLLDELGADGILQVLVEGGADVAGRFHRAGLIDEYVVYLAPAFLGGDDGRALFAGPGAATMADVWRGRFVSVEQMGDDVRVIVHRGTP